MGLVFLSTQTTPAMDTSFKQIYYASYPRNR